MTEPRRPVTLGHDEVVDVASSFVLGALDGAEMDAVREHLATCPDPHAEMTELAGVLPVLQASVRQIEPPALLRDRLMAAAAGDVDARRGIVEHVSASASTGGASPSAAAPASVPSPITRRPTPRWSWVLGLAAALAIVMLGGWNLLLQAQLDSARTYERQVASVLEAAGRPGALTAVMTPAAADGGPTGIAAVTTDGVMRIAMRDLAPTTGTEVYEAWVIVGEQAPVALGGFQVGPSGVGYLEADGLPAETGIVLALTREPRPGATAPSGDAVSTGTATSPTSA